jgi:hypothetical protein
LVIINWHKLRNRGGAAQKRARKNKGRFHGGGMDSRIPQNHQPNDTSQPEIRRRPIPFANATPTRASEFCRRRCVG